jgi:MFS family permease
MSERATAEGGGLAFALRALRSRNYRLFFGGQLISLVGTWMTSIATNWLVYRLTGSAWLLGVVAFAGQLPSFLLGPVGGLVVDRLDKRKLIMATQALAMLQSFSLAFLTLTGRITVTSLLVLNAIDGLINAFDMPARQSFLVEMIERKEDLGNAIALNSSMVNAARLVGPSIGGLVIAAAGEGWCFFIDGASFLAVIGTMLAMRVASRPPKPRHAGGAMAEMREGWDYARRFRPIRSILLLLGLVSLVGVPYTTLMPVFAAKVLHGGPHTLGWLMTASGCGALGAAIWLASRKSVLGLGGAIPAGTAVFGAGLVAFSYSRSTALGMAALVLAGAGFMVQLAASNTIVQTIVDDDKRGRVMSFFMMAFFGAAPFGSLLAGRLADAIGTPATLRLAGLCCAAGAGWFALHLEELRESIRPIYRRMGILPEVREAVRSAGEMTYPPHD